MRSKGSKFTSSPEVIDTTQGLLRVDHVEIDDRVNGDGHRIASKNLFVVCKSDDHLE